MAENKKQHYVPQFYLKQFSDDGKHLHVYHPRDKKFIYDAPIRNLCQAKYFYGKHLDLEKSLNLMETDCAFSLRELINEQNVRELDDKDVFNILSFILVQYTRTKYAKKISQKMTELFVDKFMKPKMKASVELREKGLTEKDIDDLVITYSGDYLIGMLTAFTGVEGVSDLKPILIVNKSNRKFICSDAPISLYNSIKIKKHRLIGFHSPGLLVFTPLNEDLLLLLIDSELYNIDSDNSSIIYLKNDSDADSINKLQLINCLHSVFFSKKNQLDYVMKLHSENEEIIKEKGVKSQTLPKKLTKDGKNEETILFQSTDINYPLKLSFIKLNHKKNRQFKGKYRRELSKSTIIQLVRNEEIDARVRSKYKRELKKANLI